MGWRINIKYFFIVTLITVIQGCVTDADPIFADDIEIVEIKNSIRHPDCLSQEKNVVSSDLINLNGIKWDNVAKNGNMFTATRSNPNGTDSLQLDIPFIMDNTFTEYTCSLSMAANQVDDEKLRIKPTKYTVNIDSRSDSLYIYVCQYYFRTHIVGQPVDAIFNTCIALPK